MQSSRTASACDAWLCNMHFCTVLDMIVQQLFMLLSCVGSLRGLRRTISCQKKVVNHYCEVFCFLLFDWWLLSIRVLSTIITICCLVVVQQSYSIIHKPLVHIIVFALIPDEFCNLWNDAGNLKKQPWSRCPIASVRVLNASNCTSWKIFAYARFCTHRRMISAGSLRQHVGNIKIPLWDLTFPTWLLPYFDA